MSNLPVNPPVDEGLGNSTYLVALTDVGILSGGPQDWADGRTLEVDA